VFLFQYETLNVEKWLFSLKNAVFLGGTTFASIKATEKFHLT
jgi:hypothetical protein